MEKENQLFQKDTLHSSKHQKLKNQNDYVFKRYRYQKNNILKDSCNQQPSNSIAKPINKQPQVQNFQLDIIQFDDHIYSTINQDEIYQSDQKDSSQITNNKIISWSQHKPEDIIQFDDQQQEHQKQNNLTTSHCNNSSPSYFQTSAKRALQESNISLISKNKNSSDKKKVLKLHQNQQNQKISENAHSFFDIQMQQNEENIQNQNLKGVKILSKAFEDDIIIQITDKQLFCNSKIPPGIILKCKLKRQTSLLNMLSPQYDLYLQNGLRHIVSAKKYPFRNRQLFKFSNKIGDFQSQIQRSLMANLVHNGYWLVDQPRQIESRKISYLDILIYYQQIKVNQKSRQMSVLIPPSLKSYHIGLQFDTPQLDFDWFKKQINLQLTNKLRTKNYEFKKPSTKNFVLVDDQDEQYLYLKVQKNSQNIFDIEIQHPLTPMQAMAIIMTRFDAQLK